MAPETPKGVSSRLLSMKFMQRAAASAASTPDSDAPSSKKRKLGKSDDDYDLNINMESIQAAINERDAKRQAALQQHSSNDTHWVLNGDFGKKAGKAEKKPMRVLYVGYGDFDSGDEDESKLRPGRTSTKNYKKSEDPKSAKDTSEDEDENTSPTAEGRKRKRDSTASNPRSRSLSRSNSKQTPETDKAKQFRDQRKKKDVNINRITSISNPGAGASNTSSMTCFTCQQKGHKASDCPQKPPQRSKGKR